MKTIWTKTLAVLLAAILVFGVSPAANWLAMIAAAETVSGECGADGGNLTWSLDTQTGALTISGTGDMGDDIPWEDYADSIRSVTIGDGVTSICEGAFMYCQSLTQASIGADVTRIGDYAFALSALTDVYIPSAVEEIGYAVFVCCTVSEDDEVTPTITRIDVDPDNDFYSSLDGVLYDESETTLIQYPCGAATAAFSIPNGVTCISPMSFYYSMNLESVTIPDGVEEIGENAFTFCTALQSVTIPGSTTSIGAEAFVSCAALQSVTIEDGEDGTEKEIGEDAFVECGSLTSVTIGDGVTVIGDGAFSYTALTSVFIPRSVTEIGENAFHCAGLSDEDESVPTLQRIDVDPDNAAFSSEDGVLYDKSQATLILYPSGDARTAFQIPDSVTRICMIAFYECENLTSVTIGRGVETADAYAFVACRQLTSVTFNAVNCLTFEWVFSDCPDLQTITIGSEVTQIPASAFLGLDRITTITIPDSVTAIGAEAFKNCYSLANVTLGSGLETIGDYAFQGCNSLTSIHIPSSVTDISVVAFYDDALAYICSDTADCYAKTYAEDRGIEFRLCSGHSGGEDPTNTVSGECGAEGDNVVWTLDRDTGVMTISGTGAMADFSYGSAPWDAYSTSVETVVIESGVTSVGDSAFQDCMNLTNATIGDDVTAIGGYAFDACINLTDVTFGSGLETISDYAFRNCTNLTGASFGDSLTTIGDCAFERCTNLTSISVGSGLETIGDGAFAYCFTLSEMTFPEGLTTIGSYAFMNTALTSVAIPCTVTQIGECAFAYDMSASDGFTPALQSITVDPENETYSAQDGVLYNEEKTALIQYPCANPATAFTIPNGVTTVEAAAFASSTNLTDVTIPNDVTQLGEGAFYSCTDLTDVTLGSGIQSISAYAFQNCSALTCIHIPDSVTNIGIGAFGDCASLVYAHIPAGVTEIGYDCFANTSAYICCDTTDCYAKAYAENNGVEFCLCAGHDSSSQTITGECGAEGENVLWALNLGNGRMIVSGTGAMADYPAAADAPWADYSASIQSVTIRSGVTTIGDHAFEGCVPLTDVTIGEDVTRIGDFAFASSALSEVVIPAAVTQIGAGAFACSAPTEDGFMPTLQSIDVDPDNTVYSSQNGVLYDKTQSTLILYPNAIPNASFTVPNSVTAIGAGAFTGCASLTEIHIPYSVDAIGADAFDGCANLSVICCDLAGSCAETYAKENGLQFRYCAGHDGQSFVAGDANGDGVVTLKDVVLMRRYLAGGWNVTVFGRCADVDASNTITLQDVALISRYLAGGWGVVLQ